MIYQEIIHNYIYNTQIHTIKWVLIQKYTYNYMSIHTYLNKYIHIQTIIFVFIRGYTYNYMSIYIIYLLYIYLCIHFMSIYESLYLGHT